MANEVNFYRGTNYGLSPEHSSDSNPTVTLPYRAKASSFALATDPRTANQLKAVTEKFNTGARTVEVQMITPDVAESIPTQHLDEIRRLKKLVGGDLTLHGPLIDPTGISKQGWDETDRLQAERQMWLAVQRAHQLGDQDKKENIVVTFHASNGLPEPIAKEMAMTPEGKKEEKVTSYWAVNERQGQFAQVPVQKNELTGESDPVALLDNFNKDSWASKMSHISFQTTNGTELISPLSQGAKSEEDGALTSSERALNLYTKYKSRTGQEWLKELDEPSQKGATKLASRIEDGEIRLKDAYQQLQAQFNEAWYAVQKSGNQEDLTRLEEYKKRIQKKKEEFTKPENLSDFANEVQNGITLLNTLKTTPQALTPLKDFAINKASETFSNLALSSYKEFKDSAPIISVENPPAGMGLSRGQDLKEVVKASQEKFIEKAIKPIDKGGAGLSKEQAEAEAKKLIGVTWDVGHINMIRKLGYDKEALLEQTKAVAPFVKHIHLSDNFGMDHTELPMGMGNVPMQEHMAILNNQFKDKIDDIKKVVEVGNWYQHFQTTPFVETLQAFGSPIYGMKMQPYWNQSAGMMGGYFAGQGAINPEVHHSIYGAGFSSLPTELGGQMTGKSRFSGTPNE